MRAVDGLSLSIEAGETLAIVGENWLVATADGARHHGICSIRQRGSVGGEVLFVADLSARWIARCSSCKSISDDRGPHDVTSNPLLTAGRRQLMEVVLLTNPSRPPEPASARSIFSGACVFLIQNDGSTTIRITCPAA